MEFDGYYILSDLLESPTSTSGGLKRHRLELFYGLASVLYIALMAVSRCSTG